MRRAQSFFLTLILMAVGPWGRKISRLENHQPWLVSTRSPPPLRRGVPDASLMTSAHATPFGNSQTPQTRGLRQPDLGCAKLASAR